MKYHVVVWPKYSAQVTFAEIARSFHWFVSVCNSYQCTLSDAFSNDPGTTNIVFGANEILYKPIPMPDNCIIVNLEQMGEGQLWSDSKYIDLLKKYPVWDYSISNIKYLLDSGVKKVSKFTIGYTKALETCAAVKPADPAIDVVFFGALNNRRTKIRDQLTQRGMSVVFANNVFGDTRDRMIANSKVVLNIHYYESKVLEVVRISHLLSNSKCVVSEPSCESEVDTVWGSGVVFADYSKLADTVEKYVRNSQLRKKQEQAAYQFITNYPLSLPIENVPTTAQ